MSDSSVTFPEFPLQWEMSTAERFALVGLLARWRPACALEVGTHFGGSLQVLAAHCRQVYSIDMDPAVRASLSGRLPNTTCLCGPSRLLIPEVLDEIRSRNKSLEFVLVDGDHSTAGVQADISALLQYRPSAPMRILLHDSFNPDCRKGMLRAAWAECPFVHEVELDFVPGTFHATSQGGALARSMWGGFALAVLHPEKRSGALEIKMGQEALHRIVFRHSSHRLWHKVWRALRRGLKR